MLFFARRTSRVSIPSQAGTLRVGIARKALNDFRKACVDPLQIVDFMLFYSDYLNP